MCTFSNNNVKLVTNRWTILILVPTLVLIVAATAVAQPSSTGAENKAEGSATSQYQYEDTECDESQYSDGSTNHKDSAAHSEEDTTGHEESGAHCGDETTGHEGPPLTRAPEMKTKAMAAVRISRGSTRLEALYRADS